MTHLVKFNGEYVLVDSLHSPQHKLFLNDLVSALNGNAYPDECLTNEDINFNPEEDCIISFVGPVVNKNIQSFYR